MKWDTFSNQQTKTTLKNKPNLNKASWADTRIGIFN